jgi:hypothetical protein
MLAWTIYISFLGVAVLMCLPRVARFTRICRLPNQLQQLNFFP